MVDLMTPQGEALLESGQIPWQVYPRPQMRRESYVNLNGHWDYTVSADPALPTAYDSKILVPFCPESQLSGIQSHPKDGDYLYYRRYFSLPEGFCKGKVLLHIGAADQIAKVYVNQTLVGTHVGGYESFTMDITHALQKENELTEQVQDDLRDQSH